MIQGCYKNQKAKNYIVGTFQKRAEEFSEGEGALFQMNAQMAGEMANQLNNLPICEGDDFKNLTCDNVEGSGKRKKSTRKPSAYQEFIKECMNRPENKSQMIGKRPGEAGGASHVMKDICVPEWNDKKK